MISIFFYLIRNNRKRILLLLLSRIYIPSSSSLKNQNTQWTIILIVNRQGSFIGTYSMQQIIIDRQQRFSDNERGEIQTTNYHMKNINILFRKIFYIHYYYSSKYVCSSRCLPTTGFAQPTSALGFPLATTKIFTPNLLVFIIVLCLRSI